MKKDVARKIKIIQHDGILRSINHLKVGQRKDYINPVQSNNIFARDMCQVLVMSDNIAFGIIHYFNNKHLMLTKHLYALN